MAERVAEPVHRDAAVLRRCPEKGGVHAGCACAIEEPELRRHPNAGAVPFADGGVAPPAVHDVLRRNGQPLDAGVREQMQDRLGGDFTRVRVHQGSHADASAAAVGARAYTVGTDVVFAHDQYRPGTPSGDQVLAHELTHVMQDGATYTGGSIQVAALDSPAETQAERPVTQAGRPVTQAERAVIRRSALRLRRLPNAQCVALLREQGRSDSASGIAVHHEITALFRRRFGPTPGFRIESGAATPEDTDKRDTVIDPQLIGGVLSGFGHPDVAVRNKSRRQMMLAEVKSARWGRYAFAIGQLDRYIENGNDEHNDDLRARLGIDKFVAMPTSTMRLPRVLLVRGRRFRVVWCQPGIILYKEIKPKKKKKQAKKRKTTKKQTTKKQPAKRQPAKKPAAKTPAVKGGNIGLGLSINSSSSGTLNAGIGVSINSNGVSVGTVSAGIVYDSQGAAIGSIGAGANVNTQSAGALTAGAGTNKDSQIAGGLTAGAGENEEVRAAGVATVGKGRNVGVNGASAGVTGSTDTQEVSGVSAGRTGVTGQGSGTGDAGTPEGGTPDAGTPARGVPDTDADDTGTPDAGTRAAETPAGGGAVSRQAMLDRLQQGAPQVPRAELERLLAEAAKVDAALRRASPAQRRLMEAIAITSPDGEFAIPASDWIDMMLSATQGIQEQDIDYLIGVEWSPGQTTADELRQKVQAVIANRQKAAAGPRAPKTGGDPAGKDKQRVRLGLPPLKSSKRTAEPADEKDQLDYSGLQPGQEKISWYRDEGKALKPGGTVRRNGFIKGIFPNGTRYAANFIGAFTVTGDRVSIVVESSTALMAPDGTPLTGDNALAGLTLTGTVQ
ncbi:eCIS core domain-containing protein [Jidongwangia harbinensis]|uniref:eCIS core domain-containing protein n=1 Tax=Jidongwangia harbinensis TaxID=2878561 RepID=UPI001CD9D6CF|nr:DUF4157 domain-containing protein [Jidongwangia harbinensis]MCA2218015.1 DUF4157 domain-containing protein [Jidongwangia harbinensis]